jgi:hypothetical protein
LRSRLVGTPERLFRRSHGSRREFGAVVSTAWKGRRRRRRDRRRPRPRPNKELLLARAAPSPPLQGVAVPHPRGAGGHEGNVNASLCVVRSCGAQQNSSPLGRGSLLPRSPPLRLGAGSRRPLKPHRTPKRSLGVGPAESAAAASSTRASSVARVGRIRRSCVRAIRHWARLATALTHRRACAVAFTTRRDSGAPVPAVRRFPVNVPSRRQHGLERASAKATGPPASTSAAQQGIAAGANGSFATSSRHRGTTPSRCGAE